MVIREDCSQYGRKNADGDGGMLGMGSWGTAATMATTLAMADKEEPPCTLR